MPLSTQLESRRRQTITLHEQTVSRAAEQSVIFGDDRQVWRGPMSEPICGGLNFQEKRLEISTTNAMAGITTTSVDRRANASGRCG